MEEANSTDQSGSEQVIRGIIRRVTYSNPENGYCVLQLEVAEESDLVTVVGSMPDVGVGLNVIVRGEYVEHKKFGRQLKANSITPTTPSTIEGIERYLSSGLIRGVGQKTAQRLVERFGEETLEVIYRQPGKVAAVPGIGKHRAQLISQAFSEQKEIRAIMQFLIEHGISPGLASKIFERFKNESVEVLEKDPYLLARQIRGIGFATADSIALKLGIAEESPARLTAGLHFALEKARDDGHCFLPYEELSARAAELLGVSVNDSFEDYLLRLIREGIVEQDGQNVYLSKLHTAECFCAEFIAQRLEKNESAEASPENLEEALKHAEEELELTFSPEQREAVSLALTHKVLLITGGPGCGKTTVIRALVSAFQKRGDLIALAAPTGRAAQRMSQVCGIPASTVHRLLKYDPFQNRFQHNAEYPLERDGKKIEVLIIDETSMLDMSLAKSLFEATPDKAHIILVGDKDQLPSVGPGTVFADLVSLHEVPTIGLTRLFRREESSRINDVAHSINAGISPEIPTPDGITKSDAYFIERDDAEDCARVVESLFAEQIPKKFGIEQKDIAVLSPSNRGPLGIINLNRRIQQRINPSDIELQNGEEHIRSGDRICQRVNNYQIDEFGVFNGDTGTIYALDPKRRKLTVELWDGRLIDYEKGQIRQLSLSYALTVHRSQGSEIPCVILVLHESHYMLLERQLIYTGITRAKQLLIVVGSKRAIGLACKRHSSRLRFSRLSERIREQVGGTHKQAALF